MFSYGVRDHLWLSVDFENEVEDHLDGVRRLVDLCSCKLVSDSSLLFDLNALPKIIFNKLLFTALEQNRTLSISKLLKFCPHEELTLPFPTFSTHWRAFTEGQRLDKCLEKFDQNAQTMLSTFFCIIKEGCESSKLHTLDLNIIPINFRTFHSHFLKHLSEISKYKKNEKEYALKFSVTLSSGLDKMFQIIEIAENLGIRVILTGLDFHNCLIDEATVLKFLELLDPIEVCALSFYFVQVKASMESVLEKLKIFKKLKYLRFRYVVDLFKESVFNALSLTLSELPELSRLIINGGNLHERLELLLKKHCQKHASKKPRNDTENCCLIHNGKLEYLDISSNQLSDEDIEFIGELSHKNSIKYLDLGSNCFRSFRTMNILTSLKRSLMILDLSYAFTRLIFYDFKVLSLHEFTQLKYLNLNKIVVDETREQEQAFEEAKTKAPDLIIDFSI